MPDTRVESDYDSESLRVKAVQAAVRSWKPRDQQGEESKRRFEEHLKKFMKQMNGEAGDDRELELTTSAVVLGPQAKLLRTYDFLPQWNAARSDVDNSDEDTWEVVQRRALRKPGVFAHHPNGSPEVFEVEVIDGDPQRIHIDVRFLLFATGPTDNDELKPDAKWLNDDEGEQLLGDTFAHALEVARSLRNEALR